MSTEELDEEHDCGTRLVRVSEDDDMNEHDGPAVVCPACLKLVRVE